ncbi:Long-chain fatty acid transport protein 4 [Frankliniella fusca]|uniref:Very long-chain fatty acid transport protein n=1 Tax=Frankliniella fusca TaxID=407009 RepID=A0AAE1LES8_9NEOP|nr:Long-chain fatty acid transport protein 4 [Frankliniella fusca]
MLPDRFVHRYLGVKWAASRFRKNNDSVPVLFSRLARAQPDRVLLRYNEEQWTAARIEEYSNRVANAFAAEGFKKGDTVALFMGNCPQYVCVWLGLSKIGVIIAFVNYNLRSQPLVHSLTVADCCAAVCSEDLAEAILEARGSCSKPLRVFQLRLGPAMGAGGGAGPGPEDAGLLEDLQALLDKAAPSAPACPPPGYRDMLLYIYTSGTTGMPKAAILPHSRYLFATMAALKSLRLRQSDVIYNPLPLYHTTGGNVGIGCALIAGITVVIRSKFSASAYFTDCAKYGCTVAQYIGEMCRYVLAVPPRPEDRQHRVRLMLGNGMRPTIWKTFVDRFNIPNVVELYGATEGNANIVNLDNTIGAVGFLPQSLPQAIYPVAIIKTNLETGEIIRSADGFCERCGVDEPGMFIGLISNRDPTREFHGYVDKEASKKKVIEDVFVKGDKYFLTGDILVMDELGYLYFKDRTGESFRWKGENVASAEVEAAVCAILGLRDVTVYGVEVPGAEGRAGMAAIVDPENSLDLEVLAKGIDKMLPTYARPIFLRKVAALEMTGTYKVKKYILQKEAFDLKLVKDPLFIRSGSTFVPFTNSELEDLRSGKIRL